MNGEVMRDLRASISVLADQMLEAESLHTGETKQEVLRRVVDEWAGRKLHGARLAVRLAPRDGSTRETTE